MSPSPCRTERLRRTLLLTPGNQPTRLAKAVTLDLDAVAFDLEDGVPPSEKATARTIINDQLETLNFGHRERVVRINAVETDAFHDDISALDFAKIDTVFVPKVETAEDMAVLDQALRAAERRTGRHHPLDVIATLETPRGVLNALAIADASARTSALFFGSGDYSAATGCAISEPAFAFARGQIVAAAAAAGLQAIDAAYFVSVKDVDATAADARLAHALGFSGKVVFHPSQVAVCNDIFSPTPEEVAKAEKIIAAHTAAVAEGRGVGMVEGTFVAIDIVKMAERTLARAQHIATR